MSNVKHYPLHPNATHPPVMTCEIPLEEYESLKRENAELERMDTKHTLQIAKMNGYISHLEEERRWRKFSEEKPKEKQWILVFVENPSKYGTYIELRRWDIGCKFDVENQELYTKWMPMPSAPREEK